MAGRVIPEPYAYPAGPHLRRHGPTGWKDYSRYRPWLRDEFTFRCVYCLNRERWMDMRRGFQIDHFIPQKLRPDLHAEYNNLIYLCAACNNLKGAATLPDPCFVALAACLRFHRDGTVEALHPDGDAIIERLELDDPQLIEWRRRKIGGILSDSAADWPRFVEEMRFPNDLPDLTADVPPGNSRPQGVAESWHARRQAGTLPEVY